MDDWGHVPPLSQYILFSNIKIDVKIFISLRYTHYFELKNIPMLYGFASHSKLVRNPHTNITSVFESYHISICIRKSEISILIYCNVTNFM